LKLAEHIAAVSEGMVKRLIESRPSGASEVSEADVLSEAGYADALEAAFRERVQRWGDWR
jgi:hypothetical protein